MKQLAVKRIKSTISNVFSKLQSAHTDTHTAKPIKKPKLKNAFDVTSVKYSKEEPKPSKAEKGRGHEKCPYCKCRILAKSERALIWHFTECMMFYKA